MEGPSHPRRSRGPRSLVPSKLQGRVNTQTGNFGLMDMRGHTQEDRAMIARQTSQSIALAAAKAHNRYPLPTSSEGVSRIQPEANRIANRNSSPAPRQDLPRIPQTSSLAPANIKDEQVRLLRLLRSLRPTVVVDQLCMALAYYGGNQDATPPMDQIFPESLRQNESGSSFVRWIAEIFPQTESPASEHRVTLDDGWQPAQISQHATSTMQAVEEDIESLTRTVEDGVAADVTGDEAMSPAGPEGGGNPSNIASSSYTGPDPGELSGSNAVGPTQLAVRTSGAHLTESLLGGVTHAPPRRRGRPKGSKNKPKESMLEAVETGLVSTMNSIQGVKRTGPGRPRGSKNKRKRGDPLTSIRGSGEDVIGSSNRDLSDHSFPTRAPTDQLIQEPSTSTLLQGSGSGDLSSRVYNLQSLRSGYHDPMAEPPALLTREPPNKQPRPGQGYHNWSQRESSNTGGMIASDMATASRN